MIKICSPQLGISPFSLLGGEVYDYQTLKGFTKKGIEVFVYLPKGKQFDRKLKSFHITYSTFSHIFPQIIYSFICLPYLFKLYKKERFDILRIHSPRFLGFAGIIFHSFYPNVPILSSAVTVDDSRVYFLLEKWVFLHSKAIIVQSEYMKKRLIKRFAIPQSKIKITLGGQLEGKKSWIKKPKEAQQLNDQIILFYMGSLTKRKNPLFLIDLFKLCKDKLNNLKLVVIGSGNLEAEFKKRLMKNNLEKDVIMIKSAFGMEKNYWLSRMDVFVFPSLDEGFGLAVTEAMSFGKPVVASDRAAFKEIITNQKDGFTLPLNDQKKWVKVITKLIKNPVYKNKIGKLAKIKIKSKFNWQKTYNLNKKVIEEMI